MVFVIGNWQNSLVSRVRNSLICPHERVDSWVIAMTSGKTIAQCGPVGCLCFGWVF